MIYLMEAILAANFLLCVLAIFSKSFEDNLLQRLGISIMALFEMIRLVQVVEGDTMGPYRQWIHIAVFFYGIGTLLKQAIRIKIAPKWPGIFITHIYTRRKTDCPEMVAQVPQDVENVST